MIISERWLREWTPYHLDTQMVVSTLTQGGLEVDKISTYASPIDGVVVGKILEISPIKHAQSLYAVTVDIGKPLQIVCADANLFTGMMVAVATVGTTLPDQRKIMSMTIRGVDSRGMLCCAQELGLDSTSSGVLQLGEDAVVGQRVDHYLHFNDTILDVNIPPNRGDCLSIQGIARDLAILLDQPFHPPISVDPDITGEAVITVVVEDYSACPLYLAQSIEKIDTQVQTPLWMSQKLRRCGLKPINVIVDIANYVMLETGQPLHTFDAGELHGDLCVRWAHNGENFSALDGTQHTLTDDILVIADRNGATAIAGVIGGITSAISAQTHSVVIEAAHFSSPAIAGTARKLALHTEAAYRFERGVDTKLPDIAIRRAVMLMTSICGGIVGPLVQQQHCTEDKKPTVIKLSHQRILSLLGMDINRDQVKDILNRIASCVIEETAGWQVTVPSFRSDITQECDLVEEVARIHGYHNIPTVVPRIAPRTDTFRQSRIDLRRIQQALVARDYHEVVNYSFIDPEWDKMVNERPPITLANPIAQNMSVLRSSLLPGLVRSLQCNLHRQRQRVRIFETGNVFQKNKTVCESLRLGGLVYGPTHSPQWAISDLNEVDFYDIKSDIEAVICVGSDKQYNFVRGEHPAMHPAETATVEFFNQAIGWVGRMHPKLARLFQIPTDQIYCFELVLGQAMVTSKPHYTTIPRHPWVRRDLSIIVASHIPVGNILQAASQIESNSILKEVKLRDVYRGEKIAPNHQSLLITMTLQKPDDSLTDEEANDIAEQVLAELKRKFAAKLRD